MTHKKYIDEGISKALEKYGAFWAFGSKQFEEQKKEGVIYVNMGAGLLCPKENYKKLDKEIAEVVKTGTEMDKQQNGKYKIIRRELFNHECGYTGDFEDAMAILKEYGITKKEVGEVHSKLIQNDEDYTG